MTCLVIAYDGDCPFCKSYIQFLNLKKNTESVRLIDLRDNPSFVKTIKAKGFDPNDGLYLSVDNTDYFAEEAMTTLALLSTPNNFFNTINIWVFKDSKRAKFFYPILKFGRSTTLKILRRTPIR